MREDIQKRRRVLRRRRWGGRLGRCMMYAVIAEAFLIPLLPLAAHVALGIGCAALLLRLWIDRNFHLCRMPYDAPALLFLVIGFLSVFIAPDISFSLYNFSHLVPIYFSTYLLVGQTVRTPRELQRVVSAMALSAGIVILYGFYQFIFGIDIAAMKWVDGEAFPELSKRVFSTWENPNILAGYLDIVVSIAVGLLTVLQRGWRILALVLIVAALACLGMTYARGACLVIAVVLAGYGALRDWRVLLGIAVIGAGALLLDPVLADRLLSVFTRVDTSSEMRLAFWESTIAMILDHPFLGIGWGMYFMVYPEYDFYLQGASVQIVHAHNMYLNYAAEIGIPGALSFFWFFFGTLILAFRLPNRVPSWEAVLAAREHEWKTVVDVRTALSRWHRHRFVEGLSLGLGLAFISVALNGITDHLLFNIPSSMLLWLLAAMTAAVHTIAGEMKEG